MDVYDPVQVQAVWRRVLQPPQTAPDEEALLGWLAAEKGSAAGYQAMASRGGRFAPRLQRMAVDEAHHARRLAALFFLLYGYRPQVRAAASDTARSFSAALRSAYHAEIAAAKAYRAAARQFREQEHLFTSLAEDEERHAATLQAITAEHLRSRPRSWDSR